MTISRTQWRPKPSQVVVSVLNGHIFNLRAQKHAQDNEVLMFLSFCPFWAPEGF